MWTTVGRFSRTVEGAYETHRTRAFLPLGKGICLLRLGISPGGAGPLCLMLANSTTSNSKIACRKKAPRQIHLKNQDWRIRSSVEESPLWFSFANTSGVALSLTNT